MKRASVDLHQSHAVGEEARAKFKHQTLLQEYLQLQKEFVSKNRKLQSTKQKRDTLLAEVRFLRRRRRYLLKTQSRKLKPKDSNFQPQDSDVLRKVLQKKRNSSVNGAALGIGNSVLVLNSDTRFHKELGEEREQIGQKPLKLEKPSRNPLSDDKRVSKKKIEWQDPTL